MFEVKKSVTIFSISIAIILMSLFISYQYKDNLVIEINAEGIKIDKAEYELNLEDKLKILKKKIKEELKIELKDELKKEILYELNGEVEPETLISHAGGRIEGITYTSCKEALDKSYDNGYKFIELDFEVTSDDQVVLLHGWEPYLNKLFQVEVKKYSLEEFKKFTMINNLHQLTLEELINWLKIHPDIYIVTDIKRENVNTLTKISEMYEEVQDQFIPQIYFMDEYEMVKNLGYKNIIYTLYLSNNTQDEIVEFVKNHKLLAVTMPVDTAKTDLPRLLDNLNVFSYTHTINDLSLMPALEENGIDGFYTDDIIYKDIE